MLNQIIFYSLQTRTSGNYILLRRYDTTCLSRTGELVCLFRGYPEYETANHQNDYSYGDSCNNGLRPSVSHFHFFVPIYKDRNRAQINIAGGQIFIMVLYIFINPSRGCNSQNDFNCDKNVSHRPRHTSYIVKERTSERH